MGNRLVRPGRCEAEEDDPQVAQPEQEADLPSPASSFAADRDRVAALALRLSELAESEDFLRVRDQLERLRAAAVQLDRSFCGSWRGANAGIYYARFRPPPLGIVFDASRPVPPSRARLGLGWRSYEPADVRAELVRQGANPDLTTVSVSSERVAAEFRAIRLELVAILESGRGPETPAAREVLSQIRMLEPVSGPLIAKLWTPPSEPAGDGAAGLVAPTHIAICAEVASIKHCFKICEVAARVLHKFLSSSEP